MVQIIRFIQVRPSLRVFFDSNATALLSKNVSRSLN